MVNAWPRKTKLTNRAMIWMQKSRNSFSQKEGSIDFSSDCLLIQKRSILFHKLDKIVVSDLLWSHVFLPIHCRLKYYSIFKQGSNFWVYESYMKPHSFKIQMNQWYSSDLYSGIGWFWLLILSTKSYIVMNSKQNNITVFSSITLWLSYCFVCFSL